ncbi:MAG: hypothetical protein ACREEB_13145 [Caulobacteraceae bacterium]
MPDTPALQAAMAALDGFASRLPPDTGADLARLLSDLEVAVKAEVDAGIAAQSPKIPLVGPLAAKIMTDAANKALDDALAELTTAKSAA